VIRRLADQEWPALADSRPLVVLPLRGAAVQVERAVLHADGGCAG